MEVMRKIAEFMSSETGVSGYIASAIFTVIVIVVVKVLVRLQDRFFYNVIEKSEKIDTLGASLFSRIVQVLFWIIGICAILAAWHINIAPVIAGLGVTGMILGFALQESISSLFCGVMIAINKPFRVGDYVEIGDIGGTVSAMDIMCVTINTPDYKKVTMNNKNVWTSTIVNTTFTEKRRVDLPVGIEYDNDSEKAKEVILGLLKSYPEVLKDEKIVVEVKEYRESDILLTARPWVKPEDYWTVYWRFNGDILKKLQENGLSMAYNHVVVHMKGKD